VVERKEAKKKNSEGIEEECITIEVMRAILYWSAGRKLVAL